MTDLLIVRDRYYTKLCKLPLQWMSGHVWPLMRNDESLQPGYRHLICRWWSVLRWCLQPSTDSTENCFHSSYRLHLAAHVYWMSLPIRAIKKSLESIPVDDLEWTEWFEIDQKTRKIYYGEEMNRVLVLYWVGGVTSPFSHNDCPAALSTHIDISKNEKTKNQRYMYLGCSINGGRKYGQHKMSTIVVATVTDRKFI